MHERITPPRRMIIFTDLDGTLLHPRTYSYEKANPALQLVKQRAIPLIIVSSKTRAEIEMWRSKLHNQHPFISENGGGIYIPQDYFPFPVAGETQGKYRVVTLGMPYDAVRRRFEKMRTQLGSAVKGFGDLRVDEVMDLTGLSVDDAKLAMRRDFEEPFFFEGKTDERFLQAIEGSGLRWTRGRLFHIMGDHHKGRAVDMLCKLYERHFGLFTTIGIGDDLNDLPFLLAVDKPVLVRKLSGLHEAAINIPSLIRTHGVGPAGWNEAVLELVK